MESVLRIRNLKIAFSSCGKTVEAVNGVNLEVNAGEILVLAGESGSGKTVTALSVTRILPANARITGGQIWFCGRLLSDMAEGELSALRGSQIAYIFQEPSSFLNPVFTIGSQITEALMLHRGLAAEEAGQEARDLLRRVRINDPERVFFDYPHQLSGGMNQRAFIAMAIASRPKLLIADEPTTALDVTIESGILQLLLDLKKELGFSVLFITHNLSIAKKIADRIAVMYKGKVVEEGARDEIFANPKHFHTCELIGAYEKIGKL